MDKVQTEPKAPDSGPLAPAALSDTAEVDEKIKAGTTRVYWITPSGVEPIPSNMPTPRITRIYRAKIGKWEYKNIAGNPGPPIDGGDNDAAPPDEVQGT